MFVSEYCIALHCIYQYLVVSVGCRAMSELNELTQSRQWFIRHLMSLILHSPVVGSVSVYWVTSLFDLTFAEPIR